MKPAELLITRWSPRAFENVSINDDKAELLFEAARWAPSSMNEQPWKYYYALKEDREQFGKFLECLLPGNQIWAKNASMLILSTTKKQYDFKGRTNRHAMHDTGAANVSICLQANGMGYQAHQMGGFDPDKTYDLFDIDKDKYELASFIAIGKPGDPSSLPEDLRESELKPRQRKELKEMVKQMK